MLGIDGAAHAVGVVVCREIHCGEEDFFATALLGQPCTIRAAWWESQCDGSCQLSFSCPFPGGTRTPVRGNAHDDADDDDDDDDDGDGDGDGGDDDDDKDDDEDDGED